MSRVHLISTQATDSNCHRCQQPILHALDDGIPARVDAEPIDPAGELAALLDARWTYTLTTWRHLVHRDATQIADPTIRGTIHAQHKCTGPTQEGLF